MAIPQDRCQTSSGLRRARNWPISEVQWPARPLMAVWAIRGPMANHATDSILGEAPAIAELRRQVEHLARFDVPGNPNVPTVLLQGETGTGKGLVAHVIHA